MEQNYGGDRVGGDDKGRIRAETDAPTYAKAVRGLLSEEQPA